MEILNALNFDLWTFILMSINLIIVIAFLTKFLYKPIGKVLAEREEKIAGSIKKAEEDRKEAESLLAKYQEQIKGAQAEAQKIISNANKLAEEIKAKASEEAKQEADLIIAKARKTIDEERVRILNDLQDDLSNLIVTGAGRLIKKELSQEDDQALIQEFVEQELANLAQRYLKGITFDQELVEAELVTAQSLDKTTLQAISQTLERALGKKVSLKAKVDANILGGITLQVGEILIDGSLASRLIQLKETLVNK
mgnify:CR=1 FL=1